MVSVVLIFLLYTMTLCSFELMPFLRRYVWLENMMADLL